ncbi:hypothetical protein [Actinomyces dentalis]|uniref:hypothetical protein n=1 Tax=Actinomyces dentalis TaxID=272548 RepID=UPI000417DCE4|nr:hypothetical protein [Actinomyces dentalis]
MSTESPNRDEDKFSPAVDAEELTTLEEVFDGLEIPAPAPVLGEDGSVVASGFAPGSASGYDAGSTAASGAEAGPTARSAPGSDAGPAREPAVEPVAEPVAGPASGPARGSAAGPVAPKPTSGPATKPTPRAARAASRAVPGTTSGPAREPGPSTTRRPSSTAASSGPARTAGAAARTPAASGSAPEASTPPEAEAYPAFPSSTPRAGRHARTDGRSAASAASAASSASSTSAASSDDAADLSEAPGRSGQTTAVRRRSLFARTSADDAGTPRPTDQALPADRPGPARAAAASAPSAPDTARTPPGTARARSEAAAPESAEPAQERAGKPDGGTTGTPAKEAETPAWLTREAARAQRRSSRRSRQRSDDDILLDGSTIVGRPASRAGAHWAGVLMSLVLLPAAWFFVHGAADVLTSTVEPHRFAFDPKAIFELVAGLLTMGVALWTACRSSLGSIVVGALSAVLGLLFLLLPTPMNGLVGPVLDRLTAQSTLGADLAAYFWTDAYSGKFVVLGLFMVMVGVVSHSARRAGRREQEIIDRGRRF